MGGRGLFARLGRAAPLGAHIGRERAIQRARGRAPSGAMAVNPPDGLTRPESPCRKTADKEILKQAFAPNQDPKNKPRPKAQKPPSTTRRTMMLRLQTRMYDYDLNRFPIYHKRPCLALDYEHLTGQKKHGRSLARRTMNPEVKRNGSEVERNDEGLQTPDERTTNPSGSEHSSTDKQPNARAVASKLNPEPDRRALRATKTRRTEPEPKALPP